MSRDLDQLEATLAPASTSTPWGSFDPRAGAGAESAPHRTVLLLLLVGGLLLVVVAALFVGFRVSRSSTESPSIAPVAPTVGSEPAAPPDPEVDRPPGASYSLSAGGVRTFLATYRKKFGTSRVVDLTLYGDYVIVNVPVPGKARQQGWLWRDGTWTGFGGVRATFPGSGTVDTDRLDVPALMRNVARARRTLDVEQPSQAYVVIRFIPRIDEVPSVDVHVINSFQESGYLATTLEGKVLRAYPYTP
jgi:hypothetical protein